MYWSTPSTIGRCLAACTALALGSAHGQESDDHGNRPLDATLVEHYGVSESGRLETNGDVDVFRLDLEGRAEVEMRSSGEMDTLGTLYDSGGNVLAEDDDAGSNLNFRIVRTLDGGVYYVAVASDFDIGDYKMTARIRRQGDDHGDTSGASTFLPLGVRTTGRIAPAEETDVFRIEVPQATGLRVGSAGPADTVGELRDSADRVLAWRDDGGHNANFRIEQHVAPGIYYVHVTSPAAGSFTLQADLYESAWNLYQASVYASIVQGKCVACHVSGGESGDTRLVFATAAEDDHEATNFRRLQAFVAGGKDRATLILNKVRGLADHGGGEQIEDGSAEFKTLDRLLGLIAREAAADARPMIPGIDDQTVTVGGVKTIEIVVPGGEYTLQATTSDACIATAEASGTTLSLTGLVAGTTDITVTARDANGVTSAPLTFAVAVEPPTVPPWALPRAAPADHGIEACAVTDVLDHIFTDRAVQSVLLVADGAVLTERYADGFDVASLGTSWSVAKSFYSAAIGTAIDRGHIESLDQRASDFFDEWDGTDKEDITIRDLLEMRAGLPDPNIFVQGDQTAFALAQNPVNPRGTTFLYSNVTSQLFEPLIRRATGLHAHDWLNDTILEPIGIDRRAIGMWFDPTGTQPLTYCCLDMRPDDFARFGILFANEGVWAGDRLISADYVQTSLSAQSAFYGLQWWVMNATYFSGNATPIDVSAAHGLQGQHIYVWRDGNVVLVVLTKYVHDRTQGYVLSFANFPSTCAARNACPGSEGAEVPSYNERALLDLMAELR